MVNVRNKNLDVSKANNMSSNTITIFFSNFLEIDYENSGKRHTQKK